MLTMGSLDLSLTNPCTRTRYGCMSALVTCNFCQIYKDSPRALWLAYTCLHVGRLRNHASSGSGVGDEIFAQITEINKLPTLRQSPFIIHSKCIYICIYINFFSSCEGYKVIAIKCMVFKRGDVFKDFNTDIYHLREEIYIYIWRGWLLL